MIKVLLWTGLALLLCYLANVSLPHVVSAFFQMLQQIHQANNGR